jgi:putative Mn2+ efflux pump MntP
VGFGPIVILALGLAMDAIAVAAARGSATETLRPRDVWVVSLTFGAFHAVMPALGWLAGSQLGSAIEAWDHWLAFAILGAIGIKMIIEAFRGGDAAEPAALSLRLVLGLALATSIDALAIGVTLPIVGAPPALAITTIAIVAAMATLAGFLVGHRLRRAIGRPVVALGGLVLLGVGTKILVDHLTAV